MLYVLIFLFTLIVFALLLLYGLVKKASMGVGLLLTIFLFASFVIADQFYLQADLIAENYYNDKGEEFTADNIGMATITGAGGRQYPDIEFVDSWQNGNGIIYEVDMTQGEVNKIINKNQDIEIVTTYKIKKRGKKKVIIPHKTKSYNFSEFNFREITAEERENTLKLWGKWEKEIISGVS